LSGEKIACDLQTHLDLALDFARAGFYEEAIGLLRAQRTAAFMPLHRGTESRSRRNSKPPHGLAVKRPEGRSPAPGAAPMAFGKESTEGVFSLSPREERVGREPERGETNNLLSPALSSFVPQEEREKERASAPEAGLPPHTTGAAPLLHYYLAWLHQQCGDTKSAIEHFRRGSEESPDYCFPSRLEEIAILEAAMRANPRDARAPFYLGNLFYDRRRHREAIALWKKSARLDPGYSVVWRNLGIACFNVLRQPNNARAAYNRAFRVRPDDARVLYERDQLWKRLGDPPGKRLRELEKHPRLIAQRDDLSIELRALYNQTGQHEKALTLITRRRFQPWEGGEGQALAQHVRTHLALGTEAFARNDFASSRACFETALSSPPNLGEAKHLLANQSDIHYWLGCACEAMGDKAAAQRHWKEAASFRGDFQEMSVRAFSEMTYFSALSLGHLGKREEMKELLKELLTCARKLQRTQAKVDYFATSLPAMLLFEDDIQFRQETEGLLLQAQAHLGLGKNALVRKLFSNVLERDPNHALARELLSRARKAISTRRKSP
jgi:tetratricopeptide (TPR) repeat protein